MKRKNTSRNALVTSVLSLLMCVSMLVGTTFAWFTDEVVSGMNTIAAGNLDVDLLVDGNSVTANTPLFSGVEKWEPGVVVYENIQVANIGTLALKYQMTVNFGNENDLNGHKLSEVLKIAVIDKIADGATRAQVLEAAKCRLYILSKRPVQEVAPPSTPPCPASIMIQWFRTIGTLSEKTVTALFVNRMETRNKITNKQ